METGKKVQANSKKSASGFCAVHNRKGKWVARAIGKKVFHPCKEILADLAAKGNIVLMEDKSTSCVLDETNVQVENLAENKAFEGLTEHQIELINRVRQPHFERERI